MIKLLEWESSDGDEIICKHTNIDIKSIIENVVKCLNKSFKEKDIDVSININLNCYVFADSRMLEIIIRNILNNAIKFSLKGGNISILVWQEDEKVKVEIKDNGVGMDPDLLNLICNNIKISTNGTLNESGTGLGMNICKNYLSCNNGNLYIESKKNSGTTIRFDLPLSHTPLNDNYNELKRNKDSFFKVNKELFEGNSILIVDDDPLICKKLSFMLDEFFTIYIARDGKEALKYAINNIPDIIVSDFEMYEA